jgi:hypothetical protein
MTLISHVLSCRPCDCSPEQVRAAARPPRRRPPLSSAPALVSCPRPCLSCHPEPSYALPSTPVALSVPVPSSPANLRRGSERRHRWRSWNPSRACRWISGVHPRSGGLGLIRLDLISTVCFGSGRSGARPRSCSVAGSSLLVPLTQVAILPVPPMSCARPRDLISDVRSRSSIPLRV